MKTMKFEWMYDELKSMADDNVHEFDHSASSFGDIVEIMYDREPHNPNFHFDWNEFAIHYNPDCLDDIKMMSNCGQCMLNYVRILHDNSK